MEKCTILHNNNVCKYQYGPTGDALTRIVIYEGESEKDAAQAFCNKLEDVYDEFQKNGYKKRINYTEETGIPNAPHYNYGRYDKARRFMQENGVDAPNVDSWHIPRLPENMTPADQKKMLESLKKTNAEKRSDKLAEILAYIIIGIGAIIFFFFASFAI
jgi:hypothetical protein